MNTQIKTWLLPFTRLELPGWGMLLKRFGKVEYKYDDLWANEIPRTIRGKWHGYTMTLDLTDWCERQTYFLGRYFELHIQLMLNKVVKPGDRVVDIGANIGMIALHAAHLVGPSGRVDCFEPNPACQKKLLVAIEANEIEHIHLYPFGLSDREAELELKQSHSHTGMGTFAQMSADEVVVSTTALVKKGDDVFEGDSKAPKIIKMDIEGFEFNALKGMEKTLRAWKSMVLMEMNNQFLERAGTSTREVGRFMTDLGYSAFDVRIKRHMLRHKLDLVDVHNLEELDDCQDVLWTTCKEDLL